MLGWKFLRQAGMPATRSVARHAFRPLARVAVTLAGLNLVARFAIACLAVLLTGAFIIGKWVAGEIESGVLHRTGGVTALYVDSVVTPHLDALMAGEALREDDMRALDSLLKDSPLGRKIVAFKIWSPESEVLYASEKSLVGRRFESDDGLRLALRGQVDSELSKLEEEENFLEVGRWDSLVETYAPVLTDEGEVMAVVEFYQLPDELFAQIRDSQRRGWAIVGASTVTMYILLVGLVAGASRTITRQNTDLRQSFDEQSRLQAQVRLLNQRLRRAGTAKVLTDEQLRHRLGQDLHDGPAQDLALALLRVDTLRPANPDGKAAEAFETIDVALRDALEEIRAISVGLHMPEMAGLSWEATVEKAAREHARKTGAQIHIDAKPIDVAPAPEQRIAVFRLVQEALSNSSRHSGEAEQWVAIRRDGTRLVLSISDKGKGFDPGAPPVGDLRPRLGIQGMRERIELLGGTFRVLSAPGKGTVVEARLPLEQGVGA